MAGIYGRIGCDTLSMTSSALDERLLRFSSQGDSFDGGGTPYRSWPICDGGTNEECP